MNTDDPQYWFRAKQYGLGWGLPRSWQGWLCFFSWMVIVPLALWLLAPGGKPVRSGFIAAMVALLLGVCCWKGDPAGRRWQGGER